MIPFKAFRFLLPLVVREKAVISFGILLILVTSISQVAVPRLIGMAVERLESGIGIDLVIPVAMAMLGAVLIRGITSFWTRKTVIGSSRRIEKNLRDQMFRHIETLDGSFHAKIHTGDLMSRFNSDVDAVRMIFGPAIMYSVQTIFIMIFSITLMLQIDWQLTLWSLIPLALITLEVRFIGPKIHDRSKIGQEMLADISVHAQENFANAPVVKAFVIEDAEIDRMHRHSHNYFLQSLRIARVRAIATSSFGLFGDLALVTLLLLGGMRIITGDLSLGEFATFNGCQLLLIWPMIALGWVINLFHRGAASAKRLQDILDATPTVDDSRSDPEMTVERGEIRFDQVSFRYPESNDNVLQQISFDLPGGKTLGIVGATASGKSTLLNLIPRLAPTASGGIFIDQIPVEQFSLDALRSSIAMVPQEPFLFSATIADNISFGVDDASMDDIISVSRLVKMDDEINKFPSRY
ncbi:MAG TPA: ABC transporter ATP-binding protein, partial [Planctomycetes bacterium]|nr:ABC transporter ATP-binding protein [Planctomycetota bacterium]